MIMSIILFIIVIALLAMIISSTVRIVPQAHAYVVERLGAYQGTWSVGLHVKVPFIDRVARKVNLKEQVVDFPPQPVITKDNVTMQIDTVVYFQITDPKLYSYGVENPIMAIENLTATTLRNVIGDLELDETLTSRETINTQMRATLDVATDPWGIKVNRVELKNIILSILAWFRSMILDRLSITTMAAFPSALISCKKYLQSMSSIRHFSAASIWE